MKRQFFVFAPFLILLLLANTIHNADASAYIPFGGEYSDDKVNEGDIVIFTGTLFSNSSSADAEIVSMNVTLSLFGSKITSAKISKAYEEGSHKISINGTFTDTIKAKMNYDAGNYNVTLFFRVRDSVHTTPDKIDSYYVFTNQSLIIRGVNTAAQGFATFVSIVAVILVVFAIFQLRSKFNK